MVIFTKRAIVTILLAAAFSLGLMMFLSWSAVYAINVEGETVGYVKTFQQGRNVVEDYLVNQRQVYGESADFGEKVSVTQKFKGNTVHWSTESQATDLLAANTTVTVLAAVIMAEDEKLVTVADEDTAQALLDDFKTQERVVENAVEVLSREFNGDIDVITQRVPVTEVVEADEARTILEASEVFAANAQVVVEYKETVAIDQGTTVIPSDSLAEGSNQVIAQGEKGEAENTVRAVISQDGITQSQVLSSEVTEEPRSSVIVEGTDTVFYDIVDNGGLGAVDIPIKGEISAEYGSQGNYWTSGHTGTDIAAPAGVAVYSLGKGIVTAAGWNGAYGNMVTIDHGNGVETRYGHMESIMVTSGETVDIGTALGSCGSTGNATGSHLHLEVKVNGEFQDPALFF